MLQLLSYLPGDNALNTHASFNPSALSQNLLCWWKKCNELIFHNSSSTQLWIIYQKSPAFSLVGIIKSHIIFHLVTFSFGNMHSCLMTLFAPRRFPHCPARRVLYTTCDMLSSMPSSSGWLQTLVWNRLSLNPEWYHSVIPPLTLGFKTIIYCND